MHRMRQGYDRNGMCQARARLYRLQGYIFSSPVIPAFPFLPFLLSCSHFTTLHSSSPSVTFHTSSYHSPPSTSLLDTAMYSIHHVLIVLVTSSTAFAAPFHLLSRASSGGTGDGGGSGPMSIQPQIWVSILGYA